MRKILPFLFLILLLTSHYKGSAQISLIYNDQGELKADTTFTLNNKSIIPVLVGSNTSLQYLILTRLNIPTIMLDAGFGGIVIIEVNIQRDSIITDAYNISSIRFVSKEDPMWGHKEMLADLEFLNQKSFSLGGESADIETYNFHIPIHVQVIKSNYNKLEKYFEEGVFMFKAYLQMVTHQQY